jgi:hypothetical protein
VGSGGACLQWARVGCHSPAGARHGAGHPARLGGRGQARGHVVASEGGRRGSGLGGGAEGLSSRAGRSITLRKLQGNYSMSLMYRVLVGLALLHSGKLLRYRVSRS